MDTPTINQLRLNRDEVQQSLRTIKASQYIGQKFGHEQEYTAKGILGGIDAILIDISALTKATAKFIQKTTHAERKQLVQYVDNLSSYAKSKDLQNLAVTIDQIKPILRNIGVRQSDERKDAFEEHINSLQKSATNLSQQISDIETIKNDGGKLKEEIEAIHLELTEKLERLNEQNEVLEELLNTNEQTRSGLAAVLSDDQARSAQIEELLSSAKSHTELIESFSKKVSKRESQLEDQEVSTDHYKEVLKSFESDHQKYLSTAYQLIESAKQALEYKTAEGLSAAFTAQYERANDKVPKISWLVAASVFLVASIGIGIWVTLEKGLELEIIVSRILLLPILIGAAWFSAGQYVKKNNIAEDYAYKTVLAKSIVGFSEQFSTETNKGEDYSHYMRSVLSQIHNDPQRKDSVKSATGNDVSEYIKNTLDEINGIKKSIEAIEKIKMRI